MLILRIIRFPSQTRIRIRQAIVNPFSSAAHLRAKPLPPRRVIDEHDLDEHFIRGCGPGGQKINKTSCAVHLRHIPSGIMVKTQEFRSQAQNRKLARRLLADKVEQMEKGGESRLDMKAAIKKRKAASGKKKAKRKYRRLEEEREKKEEEEEEEEEEEGAAGEGMGGDAELVENGAQASSTNTSPPTPTPTTIIATTKKSHKSKR